MKKTGFDKETIYAPSTPGGGAVAVIRISGGGAHAVLDAVFRSTSKGKEHAKLYHGFIEKNRKRLDEVMAVRFFAPRSFTGEDMAEVHCHGGAAVMSGVLRAIAEAGARPAEPGEFTKRAFTEGKMDLSAAGAVMELIGANGAAGVSTALRQLSGGIFDKVTEAQDKLTKALAIIEAGIEYPEDDIEADIKKDALPLVLDAKAASKRLAETFETGRILREGYKVVIAGRPNVGKSSLFNMLLGRERAIVTAVPGTTRDAVDDCLIKDGVLIRLMDTAGIRHAEQEAESIGVERAKDAAKNADMALMVVDASEGITDADRQVFDSLGDNTLVVLNKCDLPEKVSARESKKIFGREAVQASALTGAGRDDILSYLRPPETGEDEGAVITSERHYRILNEAAQSLSDAAEAFETADLDCVATDIKEAWNRLGEITGVTVTEEIIGEIFSSFCLGK